MADSEKRDLKRFIPFILIGVIILAAVGIGGFFFYQYQATQKQLQVNPATGVPQVQDLVEKVGLLMELPNGEEPTVAAVSDVSKLQGQQFFANAQNGDQVLIYSNAKKAILYRPTTNKIIEVGPVNLNQDAENASASGAIEAVEPTGGPIRVALYNGTAIVGLTRQAEPELLGMSSIQVEVATKENAAKNDYAESIVVDLTGVNKQAATQLASYAKGKVGSLPAGEAKPDADILIILGASYSN